MKRILVMGGTGAMGRYAVPELLRLGFLVDVVALDTLDWEHENLTSSVADAMDDAWLEKTITETRYDVILDFMSYKLPQFKARAQLFLDNTDQYMFLSSCRVYANEEFPVRETSPRLIDVSTDEEYLKLYEKEYSLFKAAEEDVLTGSGRKNWTIILPATTYSTGRAQLVTLEAGTFVSRAFQGKPVVIPIQAKDKPATMSWAGDVGVMIARLAGKEEALGEKFIASTAEHNTWGEIAEIYRELLGLQYEWVDKEDYLRIMSKNQEQISPFVRYQLEFARMFDRITDNSKILAITGMKQEELTSLYDGMKLELSGLTADSIIVDAYRARINLRMDEFFGG
jgi:nucleoside-diphosphate-sugar epimerase